MNSKFAITLLLVLVALFATTVYAAHNTEIDFTQMPDEELMNFVVEGHEEHRVSHLNSKAQHILANYKKYVSKYQSIGKDLVKLANEYSKNDTQAMSESSEGISLTVVLNLAEKAWKFIQDNKAVYEPKKFYGNALPKGATAFDLYGWKAPVTASFSVSWKNLYKVTVGKLDYTLSFIPGGKATDAAGNVGIYLDRVTIIPTDTYVVWGYRADASVGMSSVTNAGTQKSPVAAATVDLQFTFGSLNKEVLNHSFYVRADGFWQKLHN